ncbi:hypothetical protein MNV49_002029 [Pseudohyphozyma bogoriensis]|nr:hypothetical protein MNV49_002029 [Pseudohyphozyma bogoriensis]
MAATLAQDNTSARAKSKAQQQGERKTVFRPVLDDPLAVDWPSLSVLARKNLLDALLLFLTTKSSPDQLDIADWRAQEHARRRGRVHGAGQNKDKAEKGKGKAKEVADPPAKKVRAVDGPAKTHSVTLRSNNSYDITDYVDKEKRAPKPVVPPFPKPPVLDHVAVGINEVTRALEARIRWGRWELGDPSAAPGTGEAAPASAQRGHRKVHRKRKATEPGPAPLNVAKPTSLKTLQRPSYRFLSQPITKPSTNLPSYLLPPDESTPFFKMLANSVKMQNRAKPASSRISKPQDRIKLLLEPVMGDDDPVAERALRVGTSHLPEVRKAKKRKVDAADRGVQPVDATPKAGEDGGEEGDKEKNHQEGEAVEKDADSWVPLVDLIFVCKPDINPPSLVGHLPTMAAAANGVGEALKAEIEKEGEVPAQEGGNGEESSAMETDGDETTAGATSTRRPATRPVFLIPLDIGAEYKLGDILGLRRVAAVGVSSLAPGALPLLTLVEQLVKPLKAPWLVPHLASPSASSTDSVSNVPFIETHVKHLRTTAPIDMKAANAQKKMERKEKKGNRKDGVVRRLAMSYYPVTDASSERGADLSQRSALLDMKEYCDGTWAGEPQSPIKSPATSLPQSISTATRYAQVKDKSFDLEEQVGDGEEWKATTWQRIFRYSQGVVIFCLIALIIWGVVFGVEKLAEKSDAELAAESSALSASSAASVAGNHVERCYDYRVIRNGHVCRVDSLEHLVDGLLHILRHQLHFADKRLVIHYLHVCI